MWCRRSPTSRRSCRCWRPVNRSLRRSPAAPIRRRAARRWPRRTWPVPGPCCARRRRTRACPTILASLRNTGLPIRDDRFLGGGTTIPRIRLLRALAIVRPGHEPGARHQRDGSDARARQLRPADTCGDRQRIQHVLRRSLEWHRSANAAGQHDETRGLNGCKRPAVAGTAQVSVHTPGPGGGTSSALEFTIDPTASLTVSASAVAPGSSVTATLTLGFGGTDDWLGLARTDAQGTSFSSGPMWGRASRIGRGR